MGQAFRRASGRITASSTASSSKAKNVVDRGPRVGPTDELKISRTAAFDGRDDTGKFLMIILTNGEMSSNVIKGKFIIEVQLFCIRVYIF